MKAQIGRTVKFLRAALDRSHRFGGPEPLPCTLRRATLYHDERAAAGFELDVRFAPEVWARVLEQAAFELAPHNFGEVLGDGPTDDAPIDVTLFLRPAHVIERFSTPDAFGAEAARLLDALATDPVVGHSAAWIFLSVSQTVPGHAFEAGYRHKAYEAIDAHLIFDRPAAPTT